MGDLQVSQQESAMEAVKAVRQLAFAQRSSSLARLAAKMESSAKQSANPFKKVVEMITGKAPFHPPPVNHVSEGGAGEPQINFFFPNKALPQGGLTCAEGSVLCPARGPRLGSLSPGASSS